MATADDVRRIALSLPQAVEKLSWGMPTFRVDGPGGRIFAALDEDDTSLGFRCPREERQELIAGEPAKFFLREGHDDRYPWLRLRLAALDGEDELYAVLADAWRLSAPRRLLAAHPEVGEPRD
ncbi:MmcQ/YjbR family DNA-binding protein [Streptomyces sp. NPDC015131]|uniref:MmcQ/YjbR family DNA-binding protein n=1 Tax=Streptomyces sp. NPDC015131 TaxID=3364941 RepID=UPI0036FA3D7F